MDTWVINKVRIGVDVFNYRGGEKKESLLGFLFSLSSFNLLSFY